MPKKTPATQLEREIKEALARNPSQGGSSVRDEILAARNFVARHGGFQSTVDELDRLLAAKQLSVAIKQLSSDGYDEILAARNFVARHGGFQSTVDALDLLLQIIDAEFAQVHSNQGKQRGTDQ